MNPKTLSLFFSLRKIYFLPFLVFLSAYSIYASEETSFSIFESFDPSFEHTHINHDALQSAKLFADQYLDVMKNVDDDWKNNIPKLVGNPAPYYTDDTNAPIGYEWKVSCKRIKDCGLIMVYAGSEGPALLYSSTHGKSTYERLGEGKTHLKNKLFYYSPVDQYIESENNGTFSIKALNPSEDIVNPDNLNKIKMDFAEKRKQFSPILVNATPIPSLVVTDAGTVPGTIMPCGKLLPCYSQYPLTTVAPYCMTGCVPTAMSIIFGYYDRNGYKPNLLSGVASDTAMDVTMSNTIRTYMATQCRSGEGSDQPASTGFVTMQNGIQYAKDRGYASSTAVLDGGSNLGPAIRTEIKAGRPVMINIQSDISNGHTMAGYAYTQNGLVVDSVKVNVGWGAGQPDIYMPIGTTLTSGPSKLLGMKLINILKINVQ